MPAASITAGMVMDLAASLMNDTAKTVYTYAAQIPYLNMAMLELQEHFELNAIPMSEDVSAVIPMNSGNTEIVYGGGVGVPSLPADMVELNAVWESERGANSYVQMTRKDYLPKIDSQVSNFGVYVWQGQKIKVLSSTRNNDIKIDYIRELFNPVTGAGSLINVINASSFLQYRTAGLMAEFIERNITSADAFNAYAVMALDRATGIGVRSKQTIMTRRRPFRAGYKRQVS